MLVIVDCMFVGILGCGCGYWSGRCRGVVMFWWWGLVVGSVVVRVQNGNESFSLVTFKN